MKLALKYALKYAERGLAVFPIKPNQKTPLTPHGCKDASKDPDVINAWWQKWPQAGVGIATGAVSGIFVLDVDGETGLETLQAIEKHCGTPMPVTLQSLTGSGGAHYFFQYPGHRVSNSVQGIGPSLDIRGDGGYVVVYPSVHPNGRQYEWEVSAHFDDETEIAIAPKWLLDAVATSSNQPALDDTNPYASFNYLLVNANRARANELLKQAHFKVMEGKEGRHNTCVWLAKQLQDERLTPEYARDVVKNFQRMVETVQWKTDAFEEAEALKVLHDVYTTMTPRQPTLSVKRALRLAEVGPDAFNEEEQTPENHIEKAHVEAATAGPVEKPHVVTASEIYHLTDYGNSERFLRDHGNDLLFDPNRGQWMMWAGTRWAGNANSEAVRRAKRTVRSIYYEASMAETEDHRKAIASWAKASEAAQRIKNMVALSESELDAGRVEFDADHYLMNCPNGTVDLRTGVLQPHRKSDYLTKITRVVYDPNATCPVWEDFLQTIFDHRNDLIAFIQRALGYALTGDTKEQVFFVFYGLGANGKSTLLDVFSWLMGDYACAASTSTFMEAPEQHGSREDLVALRGMRLVMGLETGSRQKLNESLIKQMTGGDLIRARAPYARMGIEFRPQFKLCIATNHKPDINGNDEGIWRRIRLVPFEIQIPAERRDKDLPNKLRAEASGILSWAVRGCMEWQKQGLGMPAVVKEASDEYREESDILRDFLQSCVVWNPRARVVSKDLYDLYCWWCERNGEKPVSQRTLANKLTERGVRREKGTSGLRRYAGLGILDTLGRQYMVSGRGLAEPLWARDQCRLPKVSPVHDQAVA